MTWHTPPAPVSMAACSTSQAAAQSRTRDSGKRNSMAQLHLGTGDSGAGAKLATALRCAGAAPGGQLARGRRWQRSARARLLGGRTCIVLGSPRHEEHRRQQPAQPPPQRPALPRLRPAAAAAPAHHRRTVASSRPPAETRATPTISTLRPFAWRAGPRHLSSASRSRGRCSAGAATTREVSPVTCATAPHRCARVAGVAMASPRRAFAQLMSSIRAGHARRARAGAASCSERRSQRRYGLASRVCRIRRTASSTIDRGPTFDRRGRD
jgi:hypothetical protein